MKCHISIFCKTYFCHVANKDEIQSLHIFDFRISGIEGGYATGVVPKEPEAGPHTQDIPRPKPEQGGDKPTFPSSKTTASVEYYSEMLKLEQKKVDLMEKQLALKERKVALLEKQVELKAKYFEYKIKKVVYEDVMETAANV